MSKRLIPALLTRIADAAVDRAVRNIQLRIDELQAIPLLRGRPIHGIELPNDTNVPVKHGLGRTAHVLISPPYGLGGGITPGLVRDRTRVLADQYDPSQYVVLYADTVTATVYVDIWVY